MKLFDIIQISRLITAKAKFIHHYIFVIKTGTKRLNESRHLGISSRIVYSVAKRKRLILQKDIVLEPIESKENNYSASLKPSRTDDFE